MEHPNLVVVHVFLKPQEADLAKSVLEDAGIQSMIQSDTVGRMREHLAWTGQGFKLLVREDDLAAARDALDHPAGALDDQLDEDPDRPPWRKFT
jgi:Putative prokaryotic signal transducing protein